MPIQSLPAPTAGAERLEFASGNRTRFVARTDCESYERVLALVREKYWSKLHALNDVARTEYAVLERLDANGSWSLAACVAVLTPGPAPFFSEQYLDQPIEHLIANGVGHTVDRRQIVELGSLASTGQLGSAMALLRAVPILLRARSYDYVLCTATNYVQRIMRSVGYNFIPLVQATAERIALEDLPKWGDYYQHSPFTGWFELEGPAQRAVARLDYAAREPT